mmetsp:Transcript_6458/g.14833  ORF Transcript_6458/g.14833 Transcript_6458/m.14833 type:complete len:85 (-) Transcript_6458:31-285(-)
MEKVLEAGFGQAVTLAGCLVVPCFWSRTKGWMETAKELCSCPDYVDVKKHFWQELYAMVANGKDGTFNKKERGCESEKNCTGES